MTEDTERIDKIDLDNGSYPIAKDIGRVLAKTNLSGAHRAILDAILDKTFGWYDDNSKKETKLNKFYPRKDISTCPLPPRRVR